MTALVVASLGRAIAMDQSVQAYRRRHSLVSFDTVDVVTMIEATPGAVAIPHIVRNAHICSVGDITAEIRSLQDQPESSPQEKNRGLDIAVRLLRWMRMLAIGGFGAIDPSRMKRMMVALEVL